MDYLVRDLRNMQHHAVSHGVNDQDPLMNVMAADEIFRADGPERQLKRKVRTVRATQWGPDEIRQIICRD